MYYRRIRDCRENRKLTQDEVASYLHCSQQIYEAYENGSYIIPTGVLIRLARLYHTSVDYLLGLTDEMRPYQRKP